MDPKLATFISASDGTAAQAELEVILAQVRPLISRITAGSQAPDDDLQDTLQHLIRILWECRASPEHREIRDFARYSSVIASHIRKQRIRSQNPIRWNLSDSLRYLIKDDKSPIGIWKEESGSQVCGYREWMGRPSESSEQLAQLINSNAGDIDQDFQDLPSTIEFIFNRIGHPLKFNDLVSIVFQLRRIRELIFVSDSPDTGSPGVELVDSSETPDQRIEWREFLTRVWGEIETLPRYQKIAYLLNFTSANGETEVFVKFGVAGIREIGKTLQLTEAHFQRAWSELEIVGSSEALTQYDEKFAILWMQLPLKDTVIAAILETDRQKVINLRKSAVERIARRMRGQENRVPDL
ncbi:MAG: hypothetical protein IPM55_22850 [Acidobacteria bacterium]|nr:hypothetical protein [Acidobacteriota bacterium]